MITSNNIKEYKGIVISGGDSYLYIPPNIFLRPYISHYCISFPTPQTMSDEYTILPSANSVLCVFVNDGKITPYYNGTSTKAEIVGTSANKNELLLLVKFHAGGFSPFCGFNQDELVDFSLDLSCVDKILSCKIESTLIESKRIEDLVTSLDNIFLNRLKSNRSDFIIAAINKITSQKGNIAASELSTEFYYSEKHIRRLFLQNIGVSPKKFSRIVRINYALWLLQDNPTGFPDIVEKAGFFDQAHFIHEFKDIFNLTPNEYIKNMSVFYNTDSI